MILNENVCNPSHLSKEKLDSHNFVQYLHGLLKDEYTTQPAKLFQGAQHICYSQTEVKHWKEQKLASVNTSEGAGWSTCG